jgi:hypothetical protein
VGFLCGGWRAPPLLFVGLERLPVALPVRWLRLYPLPERLADCLADYFLHVTSVPSHTSNITVVPTKTNVSLVTQVGDKTTLTTERWLLGGAPQVKSVTQILLRWRKALSDLRFFLETVALCLKPHDTECDKRSYKHHYECWVHVD